VPHSKNLTNEMPRIPKVAENGNKIIEHNWVSVETLSTLVEFPVI
tara:strand:+ start:375 stop:509 length:135 start_codon:yes stop_codon:yes gene_type:complete